jgi:uncharacterized protein YqhQ
MTSSTPAPSISVPSSQPGSPQQPIYGGTTTTGRISMTNGHQLTSATRRPDGTIVVHAIPAPLRRVRFAVYRHPLLRGLALLPAQTGDTIALLSLERTSTQPKQPEPATTDPHQQRSDPQALTMLAALVALALPVGGVLGTQLTLSGAAALGGHGAWLASLLAAIGFAVRPIVRWRIAQRTPTGDDLTALHGAEHQALNCLRRGLSLTDDNIAASPVESANCDSSLKATDQLVFVPMAVALEHWLPGWSLGTQLLAGLVAYLVARPLAFELNALQAAWRASGRRHGVLGLLARLGLRRQTKATTRPGQAEHRELAARALEPLLPPDQQALVGAFPSPVERITVPAASQEPSS